MAAATAPAPQTLDLVDARWVYRTLAVLLALAGVLNVAWLAIGEADEAVRLLVGLSVLAIAGLAWVLVARPPRDVRACVAFVLFGCGTLVTVHAALAGPTTSPFALYYVWLAPFSFLLWELRRAMAYILAFGVAFGVVLAAHASDAGHFVSQDLPALLIGTGGLAAVGWTVRAICQQLTLRHVAAERSSAAHHGLSRFAREALAEPDGQQALADRAAAFIGTTLGADRVELCTADGIEAACGAEPPEGAAAIDLPLEQGGVARIVRAAGRLDADETAVVHGAVDVLALAMARDAAEQRRHQELGRDRLTGLPGRERFSAYLTASVRDGGTLVLADVDDFGFVNETLGPQAGDELLAAVAARVAAVLPPGAHLARIGGDELAVFDAQVTTELSAVNLARRLQSAVKGPVQLGEIAHHTSLSVGVVVCQAGAYEDERHAIRDAHVAQRRARERGRGELELFDVAAGLALEERRRLEHELRDAVRLHQFRLVYQPVVELESGRMVGAETLVRWEHPTRGLVGPAEFIAAAECSDLIVPLGSWILREACRQLKAWNTSSPDFDDFQLGINISGRQLAATGFVASVRRLLDRYEIDGRRLVFELTETALAEDSPRVAEAVAELRDLGIRFALDDFGTGYASISYVRRFAFDTLKLDRSFVAAAGESEEDTALVTAAISMAQAMRMSIVAEGVETEQQSERLQELGCDLAQGFLFSRPVGAAAIRNAMRRDLDASSGIGPLV